MKSNCAPSLVLSSLLLLAFLPRIQAQIVDTDSDRMDDTYETAQGLVIGVDDRYGDVDSDGFPNLIEYLKGVAAGNASSVPTADLIVGVGQTYTTIGSAVAALTADDMLIVVKPGTYNEIVTNTGTGAKRIFIISEAVDPNATTVRNPNTTGNTVSSTKDLYLRGFTLTSPPASSGNGVSLTGTGYYGIVQCVLRGHSYGIYSQSANSSSRNYVDVIGCLIQDGTTYGIYNYVYPSTFRLVHTTICGFNAASTTATGTAINSSGSTSAYTLTNCVLWNGGASQIVIGGTAVTATYSCIKGTSVYTGTGNINTNPQLVQGYLGGSSPCINVGIATTVPVVPEDLRGDARVSGSAPDMGAHEYSTSGGSWTGDMDGDGLSDSDEIYTYNSYFFSNDTDADRMDDGYEIAQGLNILVEDRYGDADGDGFPNLMEYLKGAAAGNVSSVPSADRIVGTGQTYTTISSAVTSLTADDMLIVVKPGTYSEVVTNTGTGAKRIFIISEAVDPNATTVRNPNTTGNTVSSTKDLYLRGFTLASQPSASGHGVSLTGTGYYGIVQCVLRGHNYGIHSYPASSTSRNNVDVIGCLIQDGANYGIYGYLYPSTFRLVHTTICGFNAASTTATGTAIYSYPAAGSVYTLTNCVLWNGGASQILLSGTTLTASYSCIKGTSVYTGTGNINTNPLLVQGYLGSSSPCINVGAATTVPVVTEDLRGDPRVSGSGPDMGAHEYSTTGGSWAGDFDGDGLSDSAELYTHGSFFYSADTDADRMGDGYEITNGLSILVDDRYGDADGDIFPNLAEFLKSTAAGSATSTPTADRVVGPDETHTTISSALASLTGDDMIIVVKPGIYEEVVNNAPSDVALSRRLFLISETGDPATTFIRATPGTAGTVRSRKDLYLGGFTLYGVGQDGVSLTDSTVSAVAHCVIQGHRDGVAIGMSTVASRVDLINTLVSEPDTTTGRYAINAGTAAKLRLIHTTLTGHDMASTSGYGYSIYGPGSTAEITNSILWNGGATQIYGLSSVTVTRSCVRGASPPTGLGNTNADPLLVQGRPALGSTAINLGGATSLSEAKDIELNPRLFGPSPDAGCFEYQEAVPAGPPTAMDLTRITLYSGAGDFDGDGISDLEEQARGTDPLIADTDGDGVSDALDRYPLDPAATGTAGGADSTPPVISVAQPSGAVKL